MIQSVVFFIIGLFVLFAGFLLYRAFRTVKKLRSPSSDLTKSSKLSPDEKTLALAAKMGGISVDEARRRLGVLENADSSTTKKVAKALESVSSGGNFASSETLQAGQAFSKKYVKDPKKKKKRKTASKSRAVNRKK